MDLVSTIRKSGSRGGVNFSWDEVANSTHRENYLGHSLKAPVGRWQQGKDLSWYSKDKGERDEEKAAEMKKVKMAEEEAMAKALGLPPPNPEASGSNELAVQPGRGFIEEAVEEEVKEVKQPRERRERRHRERRHGDDRRERRRERSGERGDRERAGDRERRPERSRRDGDRRRSRSRSAERSERRRHRHDRRSLSRSDGESGRRRGGSRDRRRDRSRSRERPERERTHRRRDERA